MNSLPCVLLVALAAAPVAQTNTPPDPIDAATLQWAERAEGFLPKIAEANGRHAVWLGIATAEISAGKPDHARQGLAKVPGPDDAANYPVGLALSQAAVWGDDARAVQFAQGIEGSERRDTALYTVAVVQVQRRKIGRAEDTIRLMEGVRYRDIAWMHVVRAHASDGREKAAREAASLIESQETKAQALGLLALQGDVEQDRGKMTFARPMLAGYGPDPYQTWRCYLVMNDPQPIYPSDWQESEARADDKGNPEGRGLAWYQLAWEYHDRGRPEDCQRAIDKSERSFQAATFANEKANGFCLLADLCVELGQKDHAREFIAKAGKAAQETKKRPADEYRDPLWIGVLVRLGEIVAAVEKAESSEGRAAIQNWQALGVILAYEGNASEVERRLAAAPDDAARALLCVGVAEGLQRRKVSDRLREEATRKQ